MVYVELSSPLCRGIFHRLPQRVSSQAITAGYFTDYHSGLLHRLSRLVSICLGRWGELYRHHDWLPPWASCPVSRSSAWFTVGIMSGSPGALHGSQWASCPGLQELCMGRRGHHVRVSRNSAWFTVGIMSGSPGTLHGSQWTSCPALQELCMVHSGHHVRVSRRSAWSKWRKGNK